MRESNTNYLLLDKDDITKICGVISHQELMREMSRSRLQNMLKEGTLYKEKYFLVEDEEGPEEVKLCEGKMGTYYATRRGEVYMRYHVNGRRRTLRPVNRGRNHTVSILNKDYVIQNLIAKAFIKDYKDGDVVLVKNNDKHKLLKYEVDNLVVIPKEVYAAKTGAAARSKKVGLYEDGKLVRYFSSARKAAKELYCSKSTITDICNGKRKEKMFDVRWL